MARAPLLVLGRRAEPDAFRAQQPVRLVDVVDPDRDLDAWRADVRPVALLEADMEPVRTTDAEVQPVVHERLEAQEVDVKVPGRLEARDVDEKVRQGGHRARVREQATDGESGRLRPASSRLTPRADYQPPASRMSRWSTRAATTRRYSAVERTSSIG